MSTDQIHAETRDRVLYVTIDRAEKHNALSLAILNTMHTAFTDAATDETLIAAVLRGRDAKATFNAIRDFPVPVIAAMNGNAFGGGAELAVSCDFRVAAAHSRIGFVQGRLALATAWGGGPDLLDLVGRARGLRLLATSEMLSADQALEIGLYDTVSAEGENINATVETFLEPMRKQAPQSMRAFKAVTGSHRRNESRDAMHEIETDMFVKTWVHDDHWEAAERVLPAKKG